MIANLSYGVSGMENAQRALQVTGQNLTNVNTPGYTRQRLENVETSYKYVCNNGNYKFYKGSGVDVSRLRQIRDTWIDASYRNETSKGSYYGTQYEVLNEVENIFLNSSSGTLSDTLDELYGSISTLSQFPYSQDSRASFVESAQSFLTEVQYISNQLREMQNNLNDRIIAESHRANSLIADIYDLNDKICKLELNSDEANDLRDQRNLKIDELAEILPMSVTENENGKVIIFSSQRYIVNELSYDQITFKSLDGIDGYVTPVWQNGMQEVINMSKPFDEGSTFEDGGTLKALMFARGDVDANYTTPDSEIKNSIIPGYKKELDTLVNSIVTMINDLLAPQSSENGPYGADGSQYIELFTRHITTRYDETTGNYTEENPNDYYSLYTIDNLVINPDVLENYDKLCLSYSGEDSDNTLVEEMLKSWKEKNVILPMTGEKVSFESYLVSFLTGIATDAGTSLNHYENQELLIDKISSQRQAVMGASMDEELANLIKFQHSYAASARVVKTIDSMLETIILNMAV